MIATNAPAVVAARAQETRPTGDRIPGSPWLGSLTSPAWTSPSLWLDPVAGPVFAPRLLAPPYRPGTLRLAIGGTLLGNFVPWLFNEYVIDWNDITRISPTTWKNNVDTLPVWDDNHFLVNLLAHPYQGSLYYNSARSNDYGFERSFLFSVMGSVLWECCAESHRPSWSDLATTTIGGAALGEIFFRWTEQMIEGWRTRWWREVPVGVLAPSRTITRWSLGRFNARKPSPDLPQSWDLFASTGHHTDLNRVSGTFFELGYTYGDVVSLVGGAKPFTHFESVTELSYGGEQLASRFHVRGSLWPLFTQTNVLPSDECRYSEGPLPRFTEGVMDMSMLENCDVSFWRPIPFLGFDYINNQAYEFGGQSLGVAIFRSGGAYPNGTHWITVLDGHGFFGGIKSEYAYLGEIHDKRERFREYDFALGPGWGVSGILAAPGSVLNRWDVRLSAFYRWNYTKVLHGSNEGGHPANHRTKLWGGTLHVRLGKPCRAPFHCPAWGIGIDFRHYDRESRFSNSMFATLPPSRPGLLASLFSLGAGPPGHARLRIFVTRDARLRPLGLFVF